MSSDTNFNGTEETNTCDRSVSEEISEKNGESYDHDISSEPVISKRKNTGKWKICPTSVIAACIFVAVLLFFGVWKCFFDDSIIGTWNIHYETKVDDDPVSINFDFNFVDNDTLKIHNGGTSSIRNYSLETGKDSNQMFISTNNGIAVFDYSIDGNIFTGRTLSLVDRTGLLLPPDEDTDSDNETIKLKKQLSSDNKIIDNVRYYIFKLSPSEMDEKLNIYKDFKTDIKLNGTWKYKDISNSLYDYTYSFYENGVFYIGSYDTDVKGAYTITDKNTIKCRYYYLNGEEVEYSFEYSIKGDKLTLKDDSGNIELQKTEN